MIGAFIIDIAVEFVQNEIEEEFDNDENDALTEACKEATMNLMKNMCGNEGQKTIVDKYEDYVEDYIEDVIEDPSKNNWAAFGGAVRQSGQRDSAYDGTIEILSAGFQCISMFCQAAMQQQAMDTFVGALDIPAGPRAGSSSFNFGNLRIPSVRRLGAGIGRAAKASVDYVSSIRKPGDPNQRINRKYGGGESSARMRRLRLAFERGPSRRQLTNFFSSRLSRSDVYGRNGSLSPGGRLYRRHQELSARPRTANELRRYGGSEREFARQEYIRNNPNSAMARRWSRNPNAPDREYLPSYAGGTVNGRRLRPGESAFEARYGRPFTPLNNHARYNTDPNWNPITGYRKPGEAYQEGYWQFLDSGQWRARDGSGSFNPTRRPNAYLQAEIAFREGRVSGRENTYANASEAFHYAQLANIEAGRGYGGMPAVQGYAGQGYHSRNSPNYLGNGSGTLGRINWAWQGSASVFTNNKSCSTIYIVRQQEGGEPHMTDTSDEKRITVRLEDGMHEQLKNLSDDRGVKMSTLIRDVLNAYLIRQ